MSRLEFGKIRNFKCPVHGKHYPLTYCPKCLKEVGTTAPKFTIGTSQ
jgi:hypothetical protein